MKRLLIGVGTAAVLMTPGIALGQVPAPEKGFFRPLVGATVGAGPGALFGASVGVKAGSKIHITGEFGMMTNIIPASVVDQVDQAAADVAQSMNGKHSSTASATGTYGMAGFRYATPDVSGAQTYLEFSVGAAYVESTVSAQIRGSESLQGDISDLVHTPFTDATPTTEPMVAIGGGIILSITRRTAVEVGYRYARVFTADPAINMSQIFGAFRFGF